MRKTLPVMILVFFCSIASARAKYVSISTEKANVRNGPSVQYEILCTVNKYTPFKVVDTRDSWYKVKDFEGDMGWIHKSVASEAPALIVKSNKANFRDGPSGNILWVLEKTYPLKFIEKQGSWYHVRDDEIDGWLHFSTIWGFIEPES